MEQQKNYDKKQTSPRSRSFEVLLSAPVITIQEFCKLFSVSKSTYYSRREEMPPAVQIGGKALIKRDDWQNWAEGLS